MAVDSATSAQQILSNLARTDTQKASTTEDAQNRFLTLLTTQLKNQDPLNPMDNAAVTSQLAQISTVDGIERLNKTLAELMEGQQSSEALQAAQLLGRGVLVPGKGLVLTDQGSLGGFKLDAGADKVIVTITDANGLEVAKVDLGAYEAGTHSFQWDGTATDGTPAAAGAYTVSIAATSGDDKVTATALELGQVSSVIRGPKSVDLQVGSLGIFQLNEIQQIL
ncbi:flagellar hook assembly protein FlgD [Denitromonas iodatirespirans]|uniref:Basal-body rod modification protein FlgD n=1 Tax=Denitromonas iodatirespirans TaxID=2795389 RepID=A0A944D812_DENI1|nr:flagellar hook assembly protein FlgD [Denitromonas iodatirespirans]MBT0959612.1 flagellar hook assembly protein FlgD [Denitromonas iodatirespirans]